MAKKEKKRRYGNPTEVAEQRSSGANYGYLKLPTGVRMFTPEPDTIAVIDILPYEVTDKNHLDKIEPGFLWYTKPIKVHRYIGPGNDSFVCPTTFGKPCAICDHGHALKENGDEDDPNIDKKIEKTIPKYRNLYAVKVRSYDGKKKFDKDVIHLFDFSYHLFQKPFETQLKKKKEFSTFFLPDEGCSLEVTFAESSFNGNKFAEVTRVDFVERKKQYKESIVDSVPNLDEVLEVLSYDELEAKMHGDDFAEASEEKPKKKKKRKDIPEEVAPEPKKEKKKKKEEEPDDVAPTKKKKKKKVEEPEEEPTTKKKEEKKKVKSKKGKCPYDHTFGKDCDSFDDCADCDVWNECKIEQETLKKKK